MVSVKYRFYSHGKRGKTFSQEVRTNKEAQHIKKFIGRTGKAEVILHRKPSKQIKKSVNHPLGYENIGDFDF